MVYKNNFSKKNIMGEREVSVTDLFNPTFVFIEDIFKKRQCGKLTKGSLAPYVDVVREFYTNYEPFNLDYHCTTSTIKGQTLEFSPGVIKKLYELLEIIYPSLPYKGI